MMMKSPAATRGCRFLTVLVMAYIFPVLGKVLELNGGTFRNILSTHKRPLFVEFYSPDCYFCQQLETELDILSEKLKGRITVAKLDARGGYEFEDIHVKATPTLMLFKNGKAVEPASTELNGFRTADYLQSFLEMHLGPDVTPLTTASRLEAAVEERGMAVVGLFESHDSPGSGELERVAKVMRSHIRFFSANNSGSSLPFASMYQAHTLPSIFILKKHGHTVFYHGSPTSEEALHDFVDRNAYPLVGNFSMLTYYRYTEKPVPLACLFYDHEDAEENERAIAALEEAAMVMETRVRFVTVERHASEEDGRMILRKMGLSFFKSPSLAIRSPDRKQSFAYNQMWEITPPRVAEFVEKFLRTTSLVESRCWATRTNSSASEYSSSEMDSYAEFAEDEKSRLNLSDDNQVRDVDNEALRRLQKSSRKDILVIYTARWCAFSLQLEDMVRSLLKNGALDEIKDELTVVRYDVVANKGGEDARTVQNVPSLKYISARYKTIPHWYTGSIEEAEDVAQFIHAYYSLRHVEIPGEGPSPFKKKKEEDRVNKALKFMSQEMI